MSVLIDVLRELPPNLAGWMCVIAGLGIYAVAVTLSERAGCRRRTVGKRRPLLPRSAAADWQTLRGVVESGLERAEAAASLHTAARERVDAIEYTLDRLLEDCAVVMTRPEPVQPLVHRLPPKPAMPRSSPAPRPLAA